PSQASVMSAAVSSPAATAGVPSSPNVRMMVNTTRTATVCTKQRMAPSPRRLRLIENAPLGSLIVSVGKDALLVQLCELAQLGQPRRLIVRRRRGRGYGG